MDYDAESTKNEIEHCEFTIDHDYHIHTRLSTCSSDPEQTPERIIQYAKKFHLKKVCLTDHLWDDAVTGANDWYQPQNITHIRESLPLPKDDEVKMYFGCETEMDKNFTIGLAEENFHLFDFIIIPTTHLNMCGFQIPEEAWDSIDKRRELVINRFYHLLEQHYPFHKIGLAHMTCPLAVGPDDRWNNHLKLFGGISDAVYTDMFKKAAKVGIGIELNLPISKYSERELDIIIRPYLIAKECGCKFYLGSDAHFPKNLEAAYTKFETMLKLVGLTEDDKFHFTPEHKG
jgi:histidinol phosphatase-like PHP family hydrolase